MSKNFWRKGPFVDRKPFPLNSLVNIVVYSPLTAQLTFKHRMPCSLFTVWESRFWSLRPEKCTLNVRRISDCTGEIKQRTVYLKLINCFQFFKSRTQVCEQKLWLQESSHLWILLIPVPAVLWLQMSAASCQLTARPPRWRPTRAYRWTSRSTCWRERSPWEVCTSHTKLAHVLNQSPRGNTLKLIRH